MVSGDEASEDREWTEEDSGFFAEFGEVFSPDRGAQFEIIGDLVASTSETPDRAEPYIVEICCGAGELARALLARMPGARVLALDGSQAMLKRARENCTAFEERIETGLIEIADKSWRRLEQAPQAIVSSLAVHHLDAEGKQDLFSDIHASLAPGGVFVLADMMLPASPSCRDIAADQWDRAVRERSAAKYGDQRGFEQFLTSKWNFFRWEADDDLDKPSSIYDQLGWMLAAGFAEVDVNWMRAGHAVLSGRRVA